MYGDREGLIIFPEVLSVGEGSVRGDSVIRKRYPQSIRGLTRPKRIPAQLGSSASLSTFPGGWLFSVSTILGCSGLVAPLREFIMPQSSPWQRKGTWRIMSPLAHASPWKGHGPFLLLFHWPRSVIWPRPRERCRSPGGHW